jgi:hypothetical protein
LASVVRAVDEEGRILLDIIGDEHGLGGAHDGMMMWIAQEDVDES